MSFGGLKPWSTNRLCSQYRLEQTIIRYSALVLETSHARPTVPERFEHKKLAVYFYI